MISISGYSIIEKIGQSERICCYRAICSRTGRAVILKTGMMEPLDPLSAERLKREYEIGRRFKHQSIADYLALEGETAIPVLVMADTGGIKLLDAIPENGFEIQLFLQLAYQLADGLEAVHRQRILHKNLSPDTIFYNPSPHTVTFFDFEIAEQLQKTKKQGTEPERISKTLSYLSPEQTGRMSRSPDFRSDLYSLGVLFYQMCCGHLPFKSRDPAELIHCHLARVPDPPLTHQPKVPSIVSAIVMKLLSKNPEERYQGCYGLKKDLEGCLNGFQQGKIPEFPLASHDFSSILQISLRLFGRQREEQHLKQSLEAVIEGGKQIVLVKGGAGIGKSALVMSLKNTMKHPDAFLMGKYDQGAKEIAYNAVVQAFRCAIQQILIDSEETVALWKKRILSALGGNAQVIIDVIPELEGIIGQQPTVAVVDPISSKNRFIMLFKRFFHVFSEHKKPLVIFLDDMQWADSASLDLIKNLIPASNSFLLVLAYRDNEINNSHPFRYFLDNLKESSIPITDIQLSDLDSQNLIHFVADTLLCKKERVKLLATAVRDKTGGNPFFCKEFLVSLYHQRLLFHSKDGVWQWDLERIKSSTITDNVVTLVAQNLQRLPGPVQYLLKISSCMGSFTSLSTLSLVAEREISSIQKTLQSALKEGMVILEKSGVRFSHDRIQEAAYHLISERNRAAEHLRIGKILHTSWNSQEIEDNIYELVNQLNRGRKLIDTEQDKVSLARLNLKAGRKARNATAYQLAYNYFLLGIELLDENAWEDNHSLAFELFLSKAESEFLIGRFEEAENSLEGMLPYTNGSLESTKVYEQKIILFTFLMKHREAARELRIALELNGIQLPKSRHDLKRILKRDKANLDRIVAKRGIKTLITLPKQTDPRADSIISIISKGTLALYYIDTDLVALCLIISIDTILRYGNSNRSGHIFASYGMVLCGKYADLKSGYEYGRLSMALFEKYKRENETTMAKSFFIYLTHIVHFKTPLKHSTEQLQDSLNITIETGDLVYANLVANLSLLFYLIKGGTLLTYLEKYEKTVSLLPEGGEHEIYIALQRQFVWLLLGKTDSNTSLSGDHFDEKELRTRLQKIGNRNGLYHFNRTKAMGLFWFWESRKACHHADLAERQKPLESHVSFPEHRFYQSLIHLALYAEADKGEREKHLQVVRRNQAKYKIWAESCPENYLHKYLLVEAERMRISGQKGGDLKAGDLYDQAIESAMEQGFIQNQGLACELAARFHLSRKRPAIAGIYLNQAWHSYNHWGAVAKVRHMEEQHADWWQPPAPSPEQEGAASTAAESLSSSEAIDLATITKATRAISSEINLKKLLTAMMKIIIENAGAQKGALILKEGEQWMVQALSTEPESDISLFPRLEVEACDEVCGAIVYYVIRSDQSVVLGKAATEGPFTHADYVKKHRLKSVLCLPIRLKDQVAGVLYLENNLTSRAFTEKRIKVLEILVAQAAISLENARLFEKEKGLVEKLQEIDQLKDEFLANTSHELKTPLAGIIGLAETLLEQKKESTEATKKQGLQMIIRSGQRLSTLINDILDFSRLRQKELTLDISPLGVKEITELVLRQCRPLIAHKDVTLVNQVPDSLPAVAADENRLQQILFNLLGNAVKFTAVGSITVSADLENERIAITVSDTGMGIPAADLKKIFNLFEQGSGQVSSRHGGTGLGLALTQKLTELHNGSITVDSTPGEGSRFTVRLPVHPDPPQAVDAPSSKRPSVILAAEEDYALDFEDIDTRAETTDAQAGVHILVVDDDPVILKVLSNYLHPISSRISFALNGTEALESIESDPDVDLVLLDVMMPGINGYEVCRTLRQRYTASDLPIILLTARSQKEDVVMGLSAGANDYLKKPVTREELLARVTTQLNLKQSIHRLKAYDQLKAEIQKREQIEEQLASTQRQLVRQFHDESPSLKENPLNQLQTSLSSIEELLSDKGRQLLSQIKQLPPSLDQIPDQTFTKSSDATLPLLMVEVLSQTLTYWEQTTRKSKVDLAEESGLWSATLDARGTYSTRTLDRYLSTRNFPKNPRWRTVIQTAYFVLNHCPDTTPELKTNLQEKLNTLETALLKTR